MADNESTSVTKDLGIVSAYGYAKAAGYTGTEEEFEQIFLEFTENAPGLLDRLDDAVDAAEDAESTAVSAKNAAVDAKDAAVAAAATFETDTTLAVSGKAADAKVTGDEITGLKTAIIQVFTNWEQGSINYQTGAEESSTTSCRTVGYYVPSESVDLIIENDDAQELGLRMYEEDGTYIGSVGGMTTMKHIQLEEGKKYRLICTATGNPNAVTAKFEVNNKNSITYVQNQIKNIEQVASGLLSGNYIPVDSFTRHGNATTYTTTPNSVYMATTKTNTYVGTSTPADGLKSILKVGHKYRLHAKLDSYSSSAVYRSVSVRGVEGNPDSGAAVLVFTDVGEASIDFVATGYESYVTLFLSGPSSAKGQNVQYSDIWLKEIIAESAVDVAARDELNEIEPKNLFNKGFCPAFIVNKNTGELETATNAGNTASDYIEVEPNTQYFLNCNYNSTAGTKGMAFYDEDKTYISGSLMSPSGGSGRYPFVFVTPADTKYLRFSFWRNEADIYKVDTLYLGKYDEALEKKYGLSNDFNGEKLSLGSSIKVTTLNSFNPSTYGTPQGGDVYGNQLFGFCDNLTKNFVYDLDAMTIQSVAYNGSAVDNHANVATFGNAKYDANDTYPLIYISSEREKYLGVFRILDSNGYEITELSRIYYPSEIPNTYASGIVDKENNRICLAAILPSVSADKKIYFYNLPDSYDADITLESDEYSEQHPYGYIGSVDYNGKFNAATGTALYTQDCFVFNNKLYRGNGSEGTGSLNVISLEDGSLLTYANISGTVTGEPEIMAKYGERIIVISAQGVIYSIVDT